VSDRGPRYTEQEARDAVARSYSYSEVLRRLGLRPAGGNHATLRRQLERWGISSVHFDRYRSARGKVGRRSVKPLAEILVRHSTYSRRSLKKRLYAEGVKARECELCGQGEGWNGREMALILDHVNGVATDNRLENLRIVCPNCAATLETHCGRNSALLQDRTCARCGVLYRPRARGQRYCSVHCGVRHARPYLRVPRPHTRKVERPSREQLRADLNASSYAAVGRKYGVSDNAVRKWLRWYERDCEGP
jgi:hypothetical protein